ncbi:cytochrome c oxidase assembly protein [Aquihabitans sp. G128]|uniref:cytochrome c oxidase assembly protein n=1 Tax=Aquihabitans sp. G128 TaxID=2849779 RepID=UPI001C22FD69|nr:cytochrome c oxidase assembly protein [Aquihabitans sp. G128]QXC62545.1 cytochrome c oxidase assembly protein [Aquihabitans sp. G128]
MSWWCSSSLKTWTWTPRPYLGSILIVLSVVALAGWWLLRGRHQDELVQARAGSQATAATGSSTGRSFAFVLGVVGLWACLDWPLATLGAGYLATAQMIRQILMVMVVAPLLLFSMPAPLAVRIFGWGKRLTVLRWLARPIVAVPAAASILVGVNAPAFVDYLVKTPYGAFAMDGAWVFAGFALWMPVQCPHPGVRRLTGGAGITYLIGQSIVPVLPGFFMTWSDFPIYRTYELAPRVFQGFDAVTDQQTAAAVLQVGGMVLLWVQISYRFLHWAYEQMDEDRAGRTGGKAMAEAGTATP